MAKDKKKSKKSKAAERDFPLAIYPEAQSFDVIEKGNAQSKSSTSMSFTVSSGNEPTPDNDPKGNYESDPREMMRQKMDALWFAYEKSPWIRKCVKAIAVAVSKKWEIVPRDQSAQIDPAQQQRIEMFLNNIYADPKLPETFEAFLRKMAIGLLVFGHVVCEYRTTSGKAELKKAFTNSLEKAGFGPSLLPDYEQEVDDAVGAVPEDGTPAYLRILPTQSIEVKVDPFGNVIEYIQWTWQGKQIKFTPDEIFHVVHPDSFNFAYGESQIEGLALLATLDGLIDQRQKHILSGDSAIDTLVTLEDATPENIRKVSTELISKYKGANSALRFLVAPKSVEVQNIAQSKDADFLKLKEWLRDEICMCLGVPLSMVGVIDGTAGKGSGADQHNRNFIENTCRPLAIHIEAAFNRSIMAGFQNEGIDYILKLVLEDTDDLDAQIAANNIAIRSGQMTNNEARKIINLPHLPGGDQLWIDAKNPVALDDLADVSAQKANPPKPQAPPMLPAPQATAAPSKPASDDNKADIKKATSAMRAALREMRKADE